MRAGRSAPDTLQALLAGDAGRAVRQVGMVDAQGRVATHTGELCIPEAGGQAGDGYVVQANLMEKRQRLARDGARPTRAPSGDLAERMLAALDAAEAEGGDIRGRQSAALLVVKADVDADARGPTRSSTCASRTTRSRFRSCDGWWRCSAPTTTWARATTASPSRTGPARSASTGPPSACSPSNAEMAFWHAVALASNDRLDAATPLFRKAFAADPRWRELVRRLPGVESASRRPRAARGDPGDPIASKGLAKTAFSGRCGSSPRAHAAWPAGSAGRRRRPLL